MILVFCHSTSAKKYSSYLTQWGMVKCHRIFNKRGDLLMLKLQLTLKAEAKKGNLFQVRSNSAILVSSIIVTPIIK